jgi:predicted Zn-dependent protease
MTLKDSLIEEVLAGKYDLAKAASEYESNRKEEEHKTELSRQLSTGIQKKDWSQAESALAELEKITPQNQRANLDLNRVRILLGKGDKAGARKLAMELSAAQKDNISIQSSLASIISSGSDVKADDLELATQFEMRANDAAKGKNPFVLATLAQLSFKQGKKDQAIEFQQQAVGLAEGKYKESLEKTLATYKARETAKAQ